MFVEDNVNCIFFFLGGGGMLDEVNLIYHMYLKSDSSLVDLMWIVRCKSDRTRAIGEKKFILDHYSKLPVVYSL